MRDNIFADIRERLTRMLFAGSKIDWSPDLAKTTADILLSVWNIDFEDVDYQDPAERKKRAILSNTYLVSGYKAWHNIAEYKNLLINPDTKQYRSLSEYKELMRSVDERYNKRWIEAEYNHAQQSAAISAKWEEYEQDKDEYDLVYDAIGDGHTSDLCRALDGIVKPMDDPFWKKYTPGNHWQCRSSIRQVPKGTKGKKANLNSLPKQDSFFAQNFGETGIIFPSTHQYFQVPQPKKQEIRTKIEGLLKSLFSF